MNEKLLNNYNSYNEMILEKSMTEFVLGKMRQRYYRTNEIHNYASFISKPLNIGMFVTCDLKGNILEEPIGWQNGVNYSYLSQKEYQQAKERVIFEGFFNPFGEYVKNESLIIANYNDKIYIQEHFEDIITKLSISVSTIEDLIQFKLKLTDSAIKKYNL